MEWIPVNHSLPEINCEVAVRTKNHITTVMSYHQGFDVGHRDFWVFMFGRWVKQTKNVTHWVQLPDLQSIKSNGN